MNRLTGLTAAIVAASFVSSQARADDAYPSATWKKKAETSLNSKDNEYQSKFTETLGHGVKVVFDWSGFKPDDWKSDADRLAGMCPYETREAFDDLVRESPLYKEALGGLKQITCKPVSTSQINNPAKYNEYALGPNGTFEVRYSPGGAHGTTAQEALRNGLTLKTAEGPMSVKELVWRHATEERGNDRDESSKAQLAHDAQGMVKADCGHNVALAFDWKTLKMKDWWIPGAPAPHEQTLEWACDETVKNMSRSCSSNTSAKKKLDGVTQLVCHGAAPSALAKEKSGATSYASLAKFQLKGKELHVWFAPDTQLHPETLKDFLKK